MPVYPVITLWQPWASAMAWEDKRFETRSWKPYPTKVRVGHIIMIHAANYRLTRDEWEVIENPVIHEMFAAHGIAKREDLIYGAIIAAAIFKGWHPVEDIRDSLSAKERALGNYADGRFAWELEIVKVAAEPVVIKGGQRIWYWHAPAKIA